MDHFCCHLCMLFILILQSFMARFTNSNLIDDQRSLLAFKDQISDPKNFIHSNWSSSSSVCDWVGVSCSGQPQRVSVLDLSDVGLEGTISPQIGNLTFLTSLNLSGNNFHGGLPQELTNLRLLELVDLSFNAFNGEIPSSWGSVLNQLRWLFLNNNNFTGSIPSSLANMSNLETLALGYNLIEGKIPYLGDLKKLKIFRAQQNQLFGSIPLSLFNNRSSLQEISLVYNTLSGTLPDDMCSHVAELEALLLTRNQFSGNIPLSIGECSKLRLLSFYNNQFNGTIPRSVGNLTRLEVLYLGENNLTGEMPSEFGNLRVLETFDVSSNGINGSIPTSIFNISSLTSIYLFNNFLSGTLPCTSMDSNLTSLTVWGNFLSGEIPECISNASKLRILSLNKNSFSGLIPISLGNLIFLEELRLWSNNLTTQAPNHEWSFLPSLANCKNLTLLQISSNPLNGVLPSSISNLSSLHEFQASFCNIQGRIPMEIGSLTNLIFLNLGVNELVGSVPATIGRLQNLQQLDLYFNNLEGSIPDEICSLSRLNQLALSGNMVQGPIPSCWDKLTSLRALYLNSNQLNSTIPLTFWSLNDMLRVDLSSNNLTGAIPLDIGNLQVLVYLNLSWNQLSGEIPGTIGGLNDLQELYVSNNRVQGSIPQSLGDLTSLEALDLSDNNLSGPIPMSLEKLSYLTYFNVSFNRLEGEIPNQGPFGNFTAESFMNNSALCGSPDLEVPACKNYTQRHSNTNPMHVLRYVLPVTASIIVILTIIIVSKKCQSRRTNIVSISEGSSVEIQNENLYKRLVQATNGFSEDNLLGSGSFGSVYGGILSDEKKVAVKVFNPQSEGAFKSFHVECEVMRNILHRNLVKIINWCSHSDFKALVLEFMPNGSLDKWLYSDHNFLNILQRINIMIDVASALEYLHLGHPNPIIHCDIKPSNILLDEDMVAHVADFGIAKLLGEAESVKETMTLATIGYMAPEYGSDGVVSVKSDVYSYGILLMETFTGKKPTDEIFAGERNMKDWVEDSLSNGIMDVVDSRLLQSENEHIKDKPSCISFIMVLALECVVESPTERKDIKDVVSVLKKIRTNFLKNVRFSLVGLEY